MTEQGKAPAAGTTCVVCGRETTADPAKFWDFCLREKMGLTSMSGTDCYRRGWQRSRDLLKHIRAMIAEDTTFPGAVLRVEIDKVLGAEASVSEPPKAPQKALELPTLPPPSDSKG